MTRDSGKYPHKLTSEQMRWKGWRIVTVRFSRHSKERGRDAYKAEWTVEGKKHVFTAVADNKQTFKKHLVRERLGSQRKIRRKKQ